LLSGIVGLGFYVQKKNKPLWIVLLFSFSTPCKGMSLRMRRALSQRVLPHAWQMSPGLIRIKESVDIWEETRP
jgi:hypothetical protein